MHELLRVHESVIEASGRAVHELLRVHEFGNSPLSWIITNDRLASKDQLSAEQMAVVAPVDACLMECINWFGNTNARIARMHGFITTSLGHKSIIYM